MNIQIFGTKKNFDSKKAERYFKERGIKYQFINMKVLFREMMLSSISGWITLWIDPMIYVQMFAAGIITYGIVALLEFRRVKKVPMDEALKNVE